MPDSQRNTGRFQMASSHDTGSGAGAAGSFDWAAARPPDTAREATIHQRRREAVKSKGS